MFCWLWERERGERGRERGEWEREKDISEWFHMLNEFSDTLSERDAGALFPSRFGKEGLTTASAACESPTLATFSSFLFTHFAASLWSEISNSTALISPLKCRHVTRKCQLDYNGARGGARDTVRRARSQLSRGENGVSGASDRPAEMGAGNTCYRWVGTVKNVSCEWYCCLTVTKTEMCLFVF